MTAEFETNAYRRAHGKNPSGRGVWMFSVMENGREVQEFMAPSLNYTAAKTWLRVQLQEAGYTGHVTVRVLP